MALLEEDEKKRIEEVCIEVRTFVEKNNNEEVEGSGFESQEQKDSYIAAMYMVNRIVIAEELIKNLKTLIEKQEQFIKIVVKDPLLEEKILSLNKKTKPLIWPTIGQKVTERAVCSTQGCPGKPSVVSSNGHFCENCFKMNFGKTPKFSC